MDRKVVGVVFSGVTAMVAVVTSPQLLEVVWCSAVVVVVVGGVVLQRAYFSTFRPSGATNHWKNNVSRLSYLFAHLDLLSSETFSFAIFFLLLFSSLTLPISAFHLSILSEV